MGDKSKIEWTEATWNPIRARRQTTEGKRIGWGCQRVSPGCEHCYSETLNLRGRGKLGTHLPYTAAGMAAHEMFLDEATLTQPLRWRRPRRIFVCSMTDIFGDWVPDEWLDRIFAVMALSPQHTFQLLTKRPERMRAYLNASERSAHFPNVSALYDRVLMIAEPLREQFPAARNLAVSDLQRMPLPNVWLGVSVEDQRRADERIPLLLQCPAAVRWLSMEPLLGAVDLTRWLPNPATPQRRDTWLGPVWSRDWRGVDWAVVGGESGPDARPMHPEWALAVVRQCQAADVPVFVKQMGECWAKRAVFAGQLPNPVPGLSGQYVVPAQRGDRKGHDPQWWPAALRLREYPAEEVRS